MNESAEVIDKLSKMIEIHQEKREEYEELLNEQELTLYRIIERNKDVYKWIVSQKKAYPFKHPDYDNFYYKDGPVLGHIEFDYLDAMIVYDVTKEDILFVPIDSDEEPKASTVNFIVKNKYFQSAVKGLNYIEEMFEDYIKVMDERVNKLTQQIENVK
ncbi:hypothetical protein AQ616_18380 [Oceanobacillus sp. E9]|uniref:hypothetical protein n=1 Tax=Oceanobacillus sp. E9 TaxID=1742575 RepID=UPI00084EC445|nr:hypothetical protein [Oceanobacillus sp. E9]OEH53007.1 hypothetical protein AQ616_18380 [Oceanobacillus sp. E9]